MIYTGKLADSILQNLITKRNEKICKGYFLAGETWIAFDNTTKDCWTEEFETEMMAICWLENFFETSEIKDFKVLKVGDNLLFIPKIGFLQYSVNDSIFSSKFYHV